MNDLFNRRRISIKSNNCFDCCLRKRKNHVLCLFLFTLFLNIQSINYSFFYYRIRHWIHSFVSSVVSEGRRKIRDYVVTIEQKEEREKSSKYVWTVLSFNVASYFLRSLSIDLILLMMLCVYVCCRKPRKKIKREREQRDEWRKRL